MPVIEPERVTFLRDTKSGLPAGPIGGGTEKNVFAVTLRTGEKNGQQISCVLKLWRQTIDTPDEYAERDLLERLRLARAEYHVLNSLVEVIPDHVATPIGIYSAGEEVGLVVDLVRGDTIERPEVRASLTSAEVEEFKVAVLQALKTIGLSVESVMPGNLMVGDTGGNNKRRIIIIEAELRSPDHQVDHERFIHLELLWLASEVRLRKTIIGRLILRVRALLDLS